MKDLLTGAHRHLILSAAVAVVLLIVIAVQAYFIHTLRAIAYPSGPTNSHPMAGLSLQISTAPADQGDSYSLTIAVAGSRAFTMPVQFIQGGRAVQVPVNDASGFSKQWIKSRAAIIAQAYARMDTRNQPYLPINVDRPGAP